MSISSFFAGTITLEIKTADPAGMMDLICRRGIRLWDVAYLNELTIRFRTYESSCRRIVPLLENRGGQWRIVSREGLSCRLRGALRRPVLTSGLLLFLLFSLVLPGRIFFVQVEGNAAVCTNEILEAASALGIGFGTHRRAVRSEDVKNGLLSAIEELEWAGINTRGCVAVISVRERASDQADTGSRGCGDVVALRDGVVLSCEATRGSILCAPGQAVSAGQVLISGAVDHGTIVTYTPAQGEVFASTRRQIQVLTNAKTQKRGSIQDKQVNFSLLIGKKLINFFKGSGISGSTCVKMYSKYVPTLPGGFMLPVALVKQTVYSCGLNNEAVKKQEASELLSDFASRYIRDQMIAGQIRASSESLDLRGGVYQLTGNYACAEMIGRAQQEQIGAYNGKTD